MGAVRMERPAVHLGITLCVERTARSPTVRAVSFERRAVTVCPRQPPPRRGCPRGGQSVGPAKPLPPAPVRDRSGGRNRAGCCRNCCRLPVHHACFPKESRVVRFPLRPFRSRARRPTGGALFHFMGVGRPGSAGPRAAGAAQGFRGRLRRPRIPLLAFRATARRPSGGALFHFMGVERPGSAGPRAAAPRGAFGAAFGGRESLSWPSVQRRGALRAARSFTSWA